MEYRLRYRTAKHWGEKLVAPAGHTWEMCMKESTHAYTLQNFLVFEQRELREKSTEMRELASISVLFSLVSIFLNDNIVVIDQQAIIILELCFIFSVVIIFNFNKLS